jgi:hypothetical protein
MSTEKTCEVSDELLNAFVDDELDAAEKARLLNRMADSAALRERVCQLWQIKEQVRSAYPVLGAPTTGRKTLGSSLSRTRQALAASLVLAVGAAMGWLAHDEQSSPAGLQLTARQVAEGKVILHLASSDPERLKAALDEAETLSQEHDKSGRPVRVELLTNGGGIDLLRADVSPYAERIETLSRAHANLSFLACASAIEKARASGADVTLLPHVAIAPSALDQIMMRLQQGWTYVQV